LACSMNLFFLSSLHSQTNHFLKLLVLLSHLYSTPTKLPILNYSYVSIQQQTVKQIYFKPKTDNRHTL